VGQLTFYLDICFGKRFPESIAKARPPFAIEYHGSKGNTFKQDMPDDKWLHIVGELAREGGLSLAMIGDSTKNPHLLAQ
jgi:hypothetical protein